MENSKARYVQIAMEGAQYERARSGDFHGEIPGFYGLTAQAKSRDECASKLRASLEQWLDHRLENELSIPLINGYRLATIGLDIQDEKRDRLNHLAAEIESLRIELQQDPHRSTLIIDRIRAANRWYKSYWQLLVSLASITIVVIAFVAYDVDPVESYRETGRKKAMADRYLQIGDQLLLQAGYESAAQAYQAALDLYPSNINARNGLFKAEILKPEKGRDSYDIQLAKTKLGLAQEFIKDDYYLSYVGGVIAFDQAKSARGAKNRDWFRDEAKKYFEESMRLKPEFSENYLGLGLHRLIFESPKRALEFLEQAYNGNRRSPSILIYLASLNASYRRFDEALKYLNEANTVSTRLETLIILGDVYRYKSATDPTLLNAAVINHLEALKMASRSDLIRRDDYDELLYTYMPRKVGEPVERDLTPLPFSNLDHFKVLANYCLSLDYILSGEDKEADKALEKGFSMDACYDHAKELGGWYKNQIQYLKNEHALSNAAKDWLNNAERRFQSCQ